MVKLSTLDRKYLKNRIILAKRARCPALAKELAIIVVLEDTELYFKKAD
jgi:hypothetical protein